MTPISRSCWHLIVIVFLMMFAASIPARSDTSVFRWTAPYITRGKLVDSSEHLKSCPIHGDHGERKLAENFLQLFQLLATENVRVPGPSTAAPQSGKERKIVYPGTKWCGPGDIASDYNDLGTNKELDKCCRGHDFCPLSIESGEIKYGLTNTKPFTISQCDCEKEFRDCLHAVGTPPANNVGQIYFLLSKNCIQKTLVQICPGWFMGKRCVPYLSHSHTLSIVDSNIAY